MPWTSHAPLVEPRLVALRSCRWLEPDDALAACDPGALAFVASCLDEHARALAPYLTAPLATSFTVERSPSAARRTWLAAWHGRRAPTHVRPAPDLALTAALSDAARDARVALASGLPGRSPSRPTRVVSRASLPDLDTLDAIDEACHEAAVEALVRSPRWWSPVVADGALCPAHVLAARDLEWALAFGDAPSPWAPLLALWRRGAWPMALPGGAFLVYVPLSRHGGIIDPTPDGAPLAIPPALAWAWGTRFALLESLGCAASTLPALIPEAFLDALHGDRRVALGAVNDLGRVPGNDIVIDSANVSRFHGCIVHDGASFVAIDRESTGGTHVHGLQIRTPTSLHDGSTFAPGIDACLRIVSGRQRPGGRGLIGFRRLLS